MTTVGAVLKGIISGKSVKTLERPVSGTELGILKVSAVTWGEFRPYENKAMPPDYDPGDCPRAMDGDILISRANTRELVGAPVMVKGDHPHLLLSDKLLKLIPDESVISRRYLVLALRSPAAKQHFSQCAGGSSGSMTNITQSDIRSTPIPLPSLAEQCRIAAILDQADALRAKRREALAELDGLAQAIFVEMFGDPIVNPKKWLLQAFDQVCDARLGKMLDQKQQTGEHRRPYLRNANVQWHRFELSDVSEMDFDDDAKAIFSLRPGDILICEGGEPGRSAIWRGEIKECYYQKALHRARPKEGALLAEYLVWLLWFLSKRGGLSDHVTSATIAHLTGEKLKAMKIMVPPLAAQKTFASRIIALESLKATHRTALTELDALFASLQHRAFRGEL